MELSVDRENTLDELVGFIKGLSGRGNLSVIIPDRGLRDVLLEKLVSDNDSELFIYDPFTIKGLEQDVAVVIGGYAASNDGEFSMLLSTRHDANAIFQPGICLTYQSIHAGVQQPSEKHADYGEF